jgi:hypothetical protein
MRNGLSGKRLPGYFGSTPLPFVSAVESACLIPPTFSPLVTYAIKMNETGLSMDPTQVQDGADLSTMLMPDGSNAGRGIFQLTSSFPYDWRDPYANALYAIHNTGFMLDAESYWVRLGLQGDDLVRAIAASFNAGIGGAMAGHQAGDLDRYTTDQYAARALTMYQQLLNEK